jgi:regulator of protease activity HflC (stomatin/prohibitin superfamily)
MKEKLKYENLTSEQKKSMSGYELKKLKTNYYIRKSIKWTAIGTVILFILITFFNCFTVVETGYVGVKTKFGKVQDGVVTEGLNLKTPFIEKIIKINCKTQKIEETTEASSKDLQNVTVSIAVNYNVIKDSSNKLYQEVGTEYEEVIIKPAILESVKAIIAQYNAEELITKRSEVSNNIQDNLIEKITDKGFDVTEFNLTNIDFSDEFDKAIETKAVRQQEVETAKAELEKQKIQNEKEIASAEKDAKVMELQNQQITENTLKLKELEVQEKLIEKWNGITPTTILSNGFSALLNIGE